MEQVDTAIGQASTSRLAASAEGDSVVVGATHSVDEIAVLTQNPVLSGISDGTVIELDDNGGMEAEVLAVSAWTPGWKRLALRRLS